MNAKRWAIAAGLCLGLASPLSAAEVTVTAKTGGVTVTGELTSFDGEFYDIETADGPVTLDARAVTCAGEACPPPEALVSRFAIGGTDTAPGLMTALLEAFALSLGAELSESSDALTIRSGDEILAEISVLPSTTDTGAALSGDDPVLILTDGTLRDPVRARVIALDALVAGVAATNTLDGIDPAQLSAVASGAVTNWSSLGGPDAPITLHDAQLSGGPAATASALGWTLGDAVATTPHPRVIDAADEAANDPYGIAILPLSTLRTARALSLAGGCGISVEADGFNVKTGAYPAVFPLSLERPAIRMPVFAREFVAFLDSAPARNVIADFGFTPLGVSERSINAQGQRLANMVLTIGDDVSVAEAKALAEMMSGAKRLSPTFRFSPGSTRLDAASRAAAGVLADALRRGEYADKVVVLAGFSDADGGAAANKRLSEKRAGAVRTALLAEATDGSLDDVSFAVVGYGEAAPLVCEDDAAGAAVNRRVEVWVRDRGAEQQ